MRACCPAARRTLWASNITIRAKARATANRLDEMPSIMPTEAASALTAAQWALGMPPVLMM